MNITEDKLKAAIQIALGMRGIYTEEIESALVHHVKALSITDVVVSETELCEHPMSERADIANSNRTYCLKCSTAL